MIDRGIITGLHYPVPLQLQEAYLCLGHHQGAFPAAEKAARTVLSLPMHPRLTKKQVDYVSHTVKEALKLTG